MRRQPGPVWGPWGLAASILTFGFLLTQEETPTEENYITIPVTWEPSEPYIGGNITLTPGGKPGFGLCYWNRHYTNDDNWIFMYSPPPDPVQHNGPSYTGRETSDPKCSLHIRNLKQRDAVPYVVRKTGNQFVSEVGETTLHFSSGRKLSKAVIAGSVLGAGAGAVVIGLLFYYGFRLWNQRTP